MEVVCAVIEKNGLFLIGKRGKGTNEGVWEFPGGKVESGETNETAVIREIKEELELDVQVKRYMLSVTDHYKDEVIHVHAYLCELCGGTIKLNAHSEIKWVKAADLESYGFSSADVPILQAVKEFAQKVIIRNAHVVLDEHCELKKADILIENGVIRKIGEEQPGCGDEKIIDAKGMLVMPGMIDVHIHGALGYDFTEGTQKVIDAVSSDLAKDGVTGFLGSLTVVESKRMMRILEGYKNARPYLKGAKFLGVHCEGPYLSKQYKAVMNPLYIKPYDEAEFEQMCAIKKGLIKSMTFCPNQPGASKLLKKGIEQGIAMMIGHTDASASCAMKAIDTGASGYTHLYNAMSAHTHRNPGCVTAAFLSNGFCELIADKVHIDPLVMKMTFDAIGSKRLILITDAMNAKSLADGIYEFSDHIIEKKDGKAYVLKTGRLAGSTMSLNEGLKNMREVCAASYNQLVEMACVNPAKLLKIDDHKGRLRVGYDADLCVMDDNFNCLMTISEGKIVYEASCFDKK